MYRTLAEKRHNDWTKAIRKQKICKERDGSDWYPHLHQYSKNKIHCSCPLCKPKTRHHRPAFGMEKGRRGGRRWRHTDVKRIVAMTTREKEYMDELVDYAS